MTKTNLFNAFVLESQRHCRASDASRRALEPAMTPAEADRDLVIE